MAFNDSFRTGVAPQEWKRQVVIALDKGHGKRPWTSCTAVSWHHGDVTILRWRRCTDEASSIINLMTAFADEHDLLDASQHGFPAAGWGRNCERAELS